MTEVRKPGNMSRVAIFGAGIMGQAVYALLKKDHEVVRFFDNNAEDNQSFDGVPVTRPNEGTDFEKVYVSVVDPAAFAEIKDRLESLGIHPQKIRSYKEVLLYRARVEFLREYADMRRCGVSPCSVAEVGVFRGDFAKEINAAFYDSKLYLFDTFEGFCERDAASDFADADAVGAFDGEFRGASAEFVLSQMPHPGKVIIKKGRFPDTFDAFGETFGFVSLDADLYAPIKAGLEVFFPLMAGGGVILVHDYFNEMLPGVKKAVDEFIRETNAVFLPIGDAMSVAVIKTKDIKHE
jgi:hypothetical protein